MAIIITDIHGDLEVARAFLAYEPSEQHICVGDMIDSRTKTTLACELACLDLLLASDLILLWGNHDLAYLPERPWRWQSNHYLSRDEVLNFIGESSYLAQRYKLNGDLYVGDVFTERINAARGNILAAYAVDGWLCTHAGVSPKLARSIPGEVVAAGAGAIASWLNEEFEREITIQRPCTAYKEPRHGHGPLFNVPVCRGGLDEFGGIFWFDAEGEQTQPALRVGRQIFGHTLVPVPERGKSWDPSGGEPTSWINLNAREGAWIYDTKSDVLVELLK